MSNLSSRSVNDQPVSSGTYQARWLNRSAHFQTVIPTLFRRVQAIDWQRERIATSDEDFIDVDWLTGAGSRLVILCHGLEGSSDTHYMKGMARACASAGWDVLAYNFRGCSGEPNRLARSYHGGSTDDLALVIKHALETSPYRKLALIGFSLGGNQVLKYLGERRLDRPAELCAGVAISPPCDLSACSDQLERLENKVYQIRFLRSLLTKVMSKRALIEAELGSISTKACRNIREFDDRFVAPLNGFASAEDYYQHASALPLLQSITHPTLLLSALDDPFLASTCQPVQAQINNPLLQLNYPRHGGHVSFRQRHPQQWYWGEQQAVEFLDAIDPVR